MRHQVDSGARVGQRRDRVTVNHKLCARREGMSEDVDSEKQTEAGVFVTKMQWAAVPAPQSRVTTGAVRVPLSKRSRRTVGGPVAAGEAACACNRRAKAAPTGQKLKMKTCMGIHTLAGSERHAASAAAAVVKLVMIQRSRSHAPGADARFGSPRAILSAPVGVRVRACFWLTVGVCPRRGWVVSPRARRIEVGDEDADEDEDEGVHSRARGVCARASCARASG